MQRDKQEANIPTERWKIKENRRRIVKKIMEELIRHGHLNDKSSFPKLVQLVQIFEEKVNVSSKTEAEYISLVTAKLNSIRAQARKAAEAKKVLTNPSSEAKNLVANHSVEAKNQLTNPSAAETKNLFTGLSAETKNLFTSPSAETKSLLTNPSASGSDANVDVREQVYQRLQFLKKKYYPLIHAIHRKICRGLQGESPTRVLNSRESEKFRNHKRAIEDLFPLFQLSKSQITNDMKDRVIKADQYIQYLVKIFMQSNKQQSPDVQSKQQNNTFIQDHRVAMPTGSSQPGIINQLSVVKGPGNAVEQQTNISLQGFGVSNNAPRISETEAFGTHTNTQRISPLIEKRNNHNQVSQKPTLGSEELSPEMQRLIKAMTSISPQALPAAVGDIEKVVRMNDEIPTFISPEGWKMRPVFDPTTFDTPSVSASMFNGFNQFNDAVESDLNSPEALRAAFGDIEEVVRLNDEIQPFISPVGGVSEGWNMHRVFDPTAFGTPSVSANMFNGFNQFNDAVESDLNSPEALRAAFGDIEEVVRLNDEIQPFISPVGGVLEGWNMRRVFDPTAFGTPSVSASMFNGFNQFNDAVESDLNSPEALRAAFGNIEEVVRFNDEIQPFISPVGGVSEGWKMRRVFDPTPFDTPSVSASMSNGFNQFTDAAASDMNSLTKRRKCSQTVEIQNVLAEIKDINNRLFDCEVVIAEKENVESVVGLASEHAGGLLVKIMYNAVTINQNLVSHFTSDKKSLINPLRLLIPASYPSSSLIFLDELPLQDSEDFRALFERAKGKLRVNLESMNQPWLIKDVARAWERCAKEAILEYAHVNGGGTFTSMYGRWEFC